MDSPGATHLLEVAIDTGDHAPFQSFPYRIPTSMLSSVKSTLDNLLSLGIIEPCSGPWSSPMLPVKKKDGSIRISIGFRRLKPDPYLMPRVDVIIGCIGNSLFLSKLDLVKSFHQVPVKLADINLVCDTLG